MTLKTKKPVLLLLSISALILFIILLMQPFEFFHFNQYIDVLLPAGMIGLEQRDLLLIIQVLMLFVIVPVYILTFVFSWKYRSNNKKENYDPDLVDSPLAEYIWWGFPLVMTIAIAILTCIRTYELDPFKPIVSDKKPITIQAIALQWKWLFIYPEEKVAAINWVQFPENTPIHFEITADAPMNSLWIPKLGGQIYAMPKMKTQLYLIANKTGDFKGSSANISGVGFSGMTFTARASSEEDFHKWVESARQSATALNWEEYTKLAAPSKNSPVELYSLDDDNIFNQVINKYMHPPKDE